MRRGICFLCAAVACAQQAALQPEELATLQGHVIHAATGEPVRKAHVTLSSEADHYAADFVAITDETGQFRFADVHPGLYKLIADKAGFLAGQYGQAQSQDDGSLLKINAGDRMHDVTLRLFPAGAISGQILDAEGDPVPGEDVILWARHRRQKSAPFSPADSITSDSHGEYRFDGLMPGNYFVSAGPGSVGGPDAAKQVLVNSQGKATNLHEFRTFFPSALSLERAQSVHLESGQQETGVDIRMQRGPLLSVKGRIAGIVNPKAEYELSSSLEAGLGWTSEIGKILPNGDFVIEGLPPGKHQLTLITHSMNGPKEIGSAEIELSDENITGVAITPFRPGVVRVRVLQEGDEEQALTTGSVFLWPVEQKANFTQNEYQISPQNGVYVFDSVMPGKYRIGFTNAGQSYLKSVQSAGRPLDPESMELSDGASLDLVLTYSKNVASVSGDVELPEGQAKRALHVFLISESTSPVWGNISPAELDQFLHFSIGNIPPGKYTAFAAEDNDPDLWNNALFLNLVKSNGNELELEEKQHATVHLKPITKDMIDRIRRQLGL